MNEQSNGSSGDPYLYQLVLSLEAAAMQQMGKLQSPLTGKVERNLEVAKNSIDMLGMIERKTAGNLTEDEASLMKHVLYQLRMNYVDELNADREAGKAGPEDRPTEKEVDGDTDSEERQSESNNSDDREQEQDPNV